MLTDRHQQKCFAAQLFCTKQSKWGHKLFNYTVTGGLGYLIQNWYKISTFHLVATATAFSNKCITYTVF